MLLEKDVIRRVVIDQKIVDQFEFKEREELEHEENSIINSMVFAKEAIDDRLPRFYYLIH